MSGRIADLKRELAAGAVSCPACHATLHPWGFARPRLIRHSPGSSPRWWRPRRAICGGCSSTHVLLPAQLLARRRDSVEVIGTALVANVAGDGHRRIAARLDRPPSTVRNWLRGFRANADQLQVLATRRHHQLDANATAAAPTGSAAGDALEALGCAARAAALRFGRFDSTWAVINTLTAGRLITPGPISPS